jgi:hypothetical protein
MSLSTDRPVYAPRIESLAHGRQRRMLSTALRPTPWSQQLGYTASWRPDWLVRNRGNFTLIFDHISNWTTGFDCRRGPWRDFFFLLFATAVSTSALGPSPQPPIQWVRGALSLGVQRPGRGADNSPPSSEKVENVWSYTSTPYVFKAWNLSTGTLPMIPTRCSCEFLRWELH